ncbi:hypothetical protein PENTCL1PPCAC_12977, partial [Pristionchus entomophagus]
SEVYLVGLRGGRTRRVWRRDNRHQSIIIMRSLLALLLLVAASSHGTVIITMRNSCPTLVFPFVQAHSGEVYNELLQKGEQRQFSYAGTQVTVRNVNGGATEAIVAVTSSLGFYAINVTHGFDTAMQLGPDDPTVATGSITCKSDNCFAPATIKNFITTYRGPYTLTFCP